MSGTRGKEDKMINIGKRKEAIAKKNEKMDPVTGDPVQRYIPCRIEKSTSNSSQLSD